MGPKPPLAGGLLIESTKAEGPKAKKPKDLTRRQAGFFG
uniref:Uncharacterized protein n=1 Tax=Rhizophora mucronata TaxID=61149 RepID=A0A2P2QXV3_RHIMU